jgi:hypothetical protein
MRVQAAAAVAAAGGALQQGGAFPHGATHFVCGPGRMSAAFEAALGQLGLVDRTNPITTEVAKLIIKLAKHGERDPERRCALTLNQVSKWASSRLHQAPGTCGATMWFPKWSPQQHRPKSHTR